MKAAPQLDPNSGEITLMLGGEQRTMAFNMGTLIQFSAHYGGLQEAIDSFGENDILSLSRLCYYAVRARKHVNNLPSYFDEDIAAEWIGELVIMQPEALKSIIQALGNSIKQVGNKTGATAKVK